MTPAPYSVRPLGVLLVAVVAFFAGRASDGIKIDLPNVVTPAVETGPIFGVVVYDMENPGSILRSERDALAGPAVDEYLNARALKIGRNRQWRTWDDDQIGEADLAEESPALREAYAKAKRLPGKKPVVVFSNGRFGYEGELPDTEADILALLKKYGG